jgi:nitroimidazol reductase NimA-like FMN-containing flavoprotein (pyridoxamine 5'-phosphate oxidase superfamily)
MHESPSDLALNLATVNSRGEPFVAPIDGLFLRGTFWFGSSQSSLRFVHIRANPNVSAAYTDGEEVSVLVHGRAHEIDSASGDHEDLHDYCREVYGEGYDSWGYWGKEPFAWIEPRRLFAAEMMHPT